MNAEGLIVEKYQKGEDVGTDQEIEQEFKKRVEYMVQKYKASNMVLDLENKTTSDIQKNDDSFNVGIFRQFWLLLVRGFISEIRNPMDVRLKFIQSIVFALCIIVVFNDLGTGFAGIQNRNGAVFMLATMNAFGSI